MIRMGIDCLGIGFLRISCIFYVGSGVGSGSGK